MAVLMTNNTYTPLADGYLEQGDVYKKHHSFSAFFSRINASPEFQGERIIKVLDVASKCGQYENAKGVLDAVLHDLSDNDYHENEYFNITPFIADELSRIEDEDLGRYLIHRYRYDIYPQRKIVDDYPPYLQIEVSSKCNFRCIFCYQTDRSFSGKSSRHMGVMSFSLFKRIVDDTEGYIEFGSISSRGEPLLCPEIGKMLTYCSGKFLGLKINTNASLLTEALVHSILSGGIGTVVFSIDAAGSSEYQNYRRGGEFEKILGNLKMFEAVRNKHYSHSKIISRVSGVKFSSKQQMGSFVEMWSDFADQVVFVKYNPWENVYTSEPKDCVVPCSDLWRRMFIWHDGFVNPCDSDYKSSLSVGDVHRESVAAIWNGKPYLSLREDHLSSLRSGMEPCRRCTVV